MDITTVSEARDATIARAAQQMRAFNAECMTDRQRAACPVAERIVDRYPDPELSHGMKGAWQMFAGIDSPEFYKTRAARAIIQMRKNRLVCKRLGRNWRIADALYLGQVRHCIAEATRRGGVPMAADRAEFHGRVL